MKMNFDKNTVNFMPENEVELTKLNALWRALLDCNGPALKITPIGEFIPENGRSASFVIEGYESKDYFNIPVLKETQVYCDTCNKIQTVKAGEPIPPCCGKLMEIVD